MPPERWFEKGRCALLFVAALAVSVAFAGCTAREGNLQFQVTDQPNAIGDFQQLLVTPTAVHVHEAGDEDTESGQDGQWLTFDTDTIFDLTRLTDGNVESLVNASLPEGRYTQIRLIVESAQGTLQDGASVTVTVPSNQLLVIKPFTIEADKTTTFVMDINVVRAGGQGGSQASYQLLPVAGSSTASEPT